jgi:hypothetical protein
MAASAQQSTQDNVATLSENLKTSMAELKHYEWIETSVISLKGEEKGKKQNRCYYDAEGKLTKVATGGGTEGGKKRGLRGRAAASKKEEIAASMERAVALVHAYLPPDPARIQAARGEGRLSVRPPDNQGRAGLDIRDYLKPGDLLTVEMDANTNRILKVAVSSYSTAKDKDPVDFVADFNALPDGTIHVATTTFNLKSEGTTVKVDNSGYRKI